jgi:hypothetical protein
MNILRSTSSDVEGALYAVQRLQFTNLDRANELLKAHFQPHLPFSLAKAEIIPRVFSLNSISGSFIAETGEKYFFKTHVEPNSVLGEYYNVQLLEQAGYPVVRPVFADHIPGQQIVVYPYLNSRTLFDLAGEIDLHGGDTSDLLHAQTTCDKQLLKIYFQTLEAGEATVESPVHQLFYNRLCGPRFHEFYSNAKFSLGNRELSFSDLGSYRWVINGVRYKLTLSQLIDWASKLLHPQSEWGPTIVGHGDAHNGNLFFDKSDGALTYFDPAFAGRHAPLLDLAKPLFHNIFATWMYCPEEVSAILSMEHKFNGSEIEIEHNYRPSHFRRQLLESKLKNVFQPILHELRSGKYSRDNDSDRLRAALLCCPLLTVNLANRNRYPGAIALLGLSQCIELASPAASGESPFEFLNH